MTIHLGHRVENTTPDTELPRVFCAGIGPLQLGVVLVLFICYLYRENDLHALDNTINKVVLHLRSCSQLSHPEIASGDITGNEGWHNCNCFSLIN